MSDALGGRGTERGDQAERQADAEVLRDQVLVAEELVERLKELNDGRLRSRPLSLAITEIQTGWLWLREAVAGEHA